ncbi:MAG TPA: DUF2027 domain-containing protein [Bacteroidales bacterium]|nr:DUF2027 domain-containing protein [Bacteroidales bacterium]
MKINIGDKVRFLNDVGGGIVVSIISKTQVMVKDKDDFEYPFPINELVVVEKAVEIKDNSETDKDSDIVGINIKGIENSQKPELKNDNNTVIIFAVIEKEASNGNNFECYLINDSDHFVFYHVVLKADSGFVKLDAEKLEPNTKIMVANLDRDSINTSKEIIIQMLFYDHPYHTIHELIERRIKIVPVKFFQTHNFIANDYFEENAYLFTVLKESQGLGNSIKTSNDFENFMAEKELPEEDISKLAKPRKEAQTIEVDLHINQLVDTVIGMSNAEILQKQMEVFHKTMTEAIDSKAGKVILIHGIGNGTLKEKLRDSLTHQYKKTFEDASFREYGFGATLVLL